MQTTVRDMNETRGANHLLSASGQSYNSDQLREATRWRQVLGRLNRPGASCRSWKRTNPFPFCQHIGQPESFARILDVRGLRE